MAKLSIVRPQLTRDEVRSEIAAGNTKVSDLCNRSGLSRAIVRCLVAKAANGAEKPPAQPKPKPAPTAPPILKPQQPTPAKTKPAPIYISRTIGGGCAFLGVTLGLCNAVMNYQFWSSFGHDWLSCLVLGCIGLIIDGIALVLLPAAGALGEQRRYVLCGAALLSWLPFFALSTIASLGYTSGNIGDSLQSRDTVVRHREELEAELAAAKTERWKILETRDPLALEQQIQIAQTNVPHDNWKSSQGCTIVTTSVACRELIWLREAKVNAERRIKLDDKIHDLSEAKAKLPSIAAKDSGADQIAQMTFGLVAPEQVGNYRVRGLAIGQGFASILLAFARALLR